MRPDDWRVLADRLIAANVEFVIEPHTRFAGEVGEQHLERGVGLCLRRTVHQGSPPEHGDGAVMAGPAERAFFDHVTLLR